MIQILCTSLRLPPQSVVDTLFEHGPWNLEELCLPMELPKISGISAANVLVPSSLVLVVMMLANLLYPAR